MVKKADTKKQVFQEKEIVQTIETAVEGKKQKRPSRKTVKAAPVELESKTVTDGGVLQEVFVEEGKSPSEESDEARGVVKPDRYWEGVGRRKEAVARVRLFTKGEKGIFVNEKPYDAYFQSFEQRLTAEEALKKMKSVERFRVTAKIHGGGLHAQAEALRHGISVALTKFNPDFRKRLRRAGFLTRDPRAKERKKFGLRKARRAPQWAKR